MDTPTVTYVDGSARLDQIGGSELGGSRRGPIDNRPGRRLRVIPGRHAVCNQYRCHDGHDQHKASQTMDHLLTCRLPSITFVKWTTEMCEGFQQRRKKDAVVVWPCPQRTLLSDTA